MKDVVCLALVVLAALVIIPVLIAIGLLAAAVFLLYRLYRLFLPRPRFVNNFIAAGGYGIGLFLALFVGPRASRGLRFAK